MLNTMRPNLYDVRKKANNAIATWARASYQAWCIGWGNWYEIPVTQKYEQQRIEYLAMCENAKVLHEKLAPHLRFLEGNKLHRELPRVRVAKAPSHPDKRCKRVRKSWDKHIEVIKKMFPVVTILIWEAPALVCHGAKCETHDLDIQRGLKGRLQRWKGMAKAEDFMPDEDGNEYWNVLLLCTCYS